MFRRIALNSVSANLIRAFWAASILPSTVVALKAACSASTSAFDFGFCASRLPALNMARTPDVMTRFIETTPSLLLQLKFTLQSLLSGFAGLLRSTFDRERALIMPGGGILLAGQVREAPQIHI